MLPMRLGLALHLREFAAGMGWRCICAEVDEDSVYG